MNKYYNDDFVNILPQLESNSIDLIIIDPPYLTTNNDWDKVEVVNDFLSKELFRIAKDSASLYVWCGIGEKSQSLIRWFPIFSKYWYFKDLITWKKQRGIGMRKGWLYTREECMWFVKDNKKFIWNIDKQYSLEKRPFNIIKNGKSVNKSDFKRLTNVWTDINEVGFGTCPTKFKEIKKEIKHKTPKPIELMERIILLHTKEDDIILDAFMGSNPVGKACEKLNRNFIGIDKNL